MVREIGGRGGRLLLDIIIVVLANAMLNDFQRPSFANACYQEDK
jgi:hypothetical protein